jgi:enoyl-CoA hydratase
VTVDFAPGATGTDEVLFARQGSLGRVRLHRPQAINALTHEMVLAMHAQLEAWAADDSVTAVVLDGAGERGLCAGGDIRALRTQIMDGDRCAATAFWADEYRLNALVHRYPKPYAALMTGVVMGGGVGVSAYGSLRLVTADARVGMPETGIGFFPDVGSLYLLSRAPGELGTHLALSGSTIGGADAVHCGLADAVVDPTDLPGVVERLAAGEAVEAATVGDVAPGSGLSGARWWIDGCYAGEDPQAVLAALRTHPAEPARAAAEVVASRSPMSVAVTLEAIRRAATMSTLEEVLGQDRALGEAFLESSDFLEGVRALLVDKDHDPRWAPATLEEVSAEAVQALFGVSG